MHACGRTEIEMDVDDRGVTEIALIDNLQRKDLTAFEEADGLRALAVRFGYTHEEIATKVGKSRTSITEAFSIAGLPPDVREACRRADISSKSLLLQIARQPTDEEMRQFVEQIKSPGPARDEARRVRKTDPRLASNYVFRHKPDGDDWKLTLQFTKAEVTTEDLREALLATIESLES